MVTKQICNRQLIPSKLNYTELSRRAATFSIKKSLNSSTITKIGPVSFCESLTNIISVSSEI